MKNEAGGQKPRQQQQKTRHLTFVPISHSLSRIQFGSQIIKPKRFPMIFDHTLQNLHDDQRVSIIGAYLQCFVDTIDTLVSKTQIVQIYSLAVIGFIVCWIDLYPSVEGFYCFLIASVGL